MVTEQERTAFITQLYQLMQQIVQLSSKIVPDESMLLKVPCHTRPPLLLRQTRGRGKETGPAQMAVELLAGSTRRAQL